MMIDPGQQHTLTITLKLAFARLLGYTITYLPTEDIKKKIEALQRNPLQIPEILANRIMDYLDVRSLWQASRVCKFWRNCAILSAHTKIKVAAERVHQNLITALSTCNSESHTLGIFLTKINTGILQFPLPDVFPSCLYPLQFTPEAYNHIVGPLHRLIVSFGPHFTVLDFSNLPPLTCDVVDKANRTRSRDLTINATLLKNGHYSTVDNILIQIIAEHCPNLSELYVDHGSFTDLSEKRLSSLPSLRVLSVADCARFPSSSIARLSQTLSTLLVDPLQLQEALELGGNEKALSCPNKKRKL